MITIKKHKKDYNNIYFMSDSHYGHNRDFLYNPRGFDNAEDHNTWILEQIDSLNPNDLLIHCGDVGLSIGFRRIQDEFMNRIPCETYTVWGNHNSGVMQAYKQALPRGFQNHEVYPLQIAPNITMMGSDFLLDIDQNFFYIKHMAPLIWDDMHRGDVSRFCVCGHSHGNLKGANPDDQGLGKILDSGVENAIKYNGTAFFSLDGVVKIMKNKEISVVDHHE
jgi:calcineurin-like phosphoesterase family protein